MSGRYRVGGRTVTRPPTVSLSPPRCAEGPTRCITVRELARVRDAPHSPFGGLGDGTRYMTVAGHGRVEPLRDAMPPVTAGAAWEGEMAGQALADPRVPSTPDPASVRRHLSLARPGLRVLLVLLAAVALLECATFVAQALSYPKLGFDFSIYFAAALALRDNPHANIYDLHTLQAAAAGHHAYLPSALYLYPPHLAVLLIPLTALPYRVALLAWTLVNLAVWLTVAVILAGYLRLALRPAEPVTLLGGKAVEPLQAGVANRRDIDLFALAVSLAVVLLYGPAAQALGLGQVTLLVLCLAVGAPLVSRRRTHTIGVLLGLATAIKVFPALLIVPYALRREWRVVSSCAVFLALFTLAILPIVGPDGLWMARAALGGGSNYAQLIDNQAFVRAPTVAGRLLGGGTGVPLDWLGLCLTAFVFVAFAAVTWFVGRRRIHSLPHGAFAGAPGLHDLLGVSWALCTIVLVTPITWPHYDVLLLPAVVLCIGYGAGGGNSPAAVRPHRPVRWFALAGALVSLVLTTNLLPLGGVFWFCRPLGALILWGATGALVLIEHGGRRHMSATTATIAREAQVTGALPPSPGLATIDVAVLLRVTLLTILSFVGAGILATVAHATAPK